MGNWKKTSCVLYKDLPKQNSLHCLRTHTVLTDDWYAQCPSQDTYDFFLITWQEVIKLIFLCSYKSTFCSENRIKHIKSTKFVVFWPVTWLSCSNAIVIDTISWDTKTDIHKGIYCFICLREKYYLKAQ